MPIWANISNELGDMLVVHEVGHALDTDPDKWEKAISKIPGIVNGLIGTPAVNKHAAKDYLNVIEDARIDKRQKRRYPGSRVDYLVGYKELP
jgi:hypothetical protein